MGCGNKQGPISVGLPDKCCNATTGCDFDGTLRKVKAEPIYVQKVYDAALFNLQGIRTVTNQPFTPALGRGARIIRVLAIRCKKFFNPQNINDPANLVAIPETTLSGAEFVENECGKPVKVIGPDGLASERIIYADTQDCDELCKGTPIFGTQNIIITGNVIVEIDVVFTDDCEKECEVTLSANIPVATPENPLLLTNFFELCLPSVFDGAFLPRFAEFCNLDCEPRLATNSIMRDIIINPVTGAVKINLLIALCVTCEKKIVVPVQLCVLSTGFPVLSAEISPICSSFPTLFPKQIDEKKPRCCSAESLDEVEIE
jgi:hypothetical protein